MPYKPGRDRSKARYLGHTLFLFVLVLFCGVKINDFRAEPEMVEQYKFRCLRSNFKVQQGHIYWSPFGVFSTPTYTIRTSKAKEGEIQKIEGGGVGTTSPGRAK